MPSPFGHKKYPGCEKGGQYGYLGKPQDAYTEEDLIQLGKDLIDYMKEPLSIWAKGFCVRKGIKVNHLNYLIETYPIFKEYYIQAKAIQEEKIVTNSFWKRGDGRFGEFILTQHHEEWKKKDSSNDGKIVTTQQIQQMERYLCEENKS